jgi:hypothetical protein
MMKLVIPASLNISKTSVIKVVISKKQIINRIGHHPTEKSMFKNSKAFFSIGPSFNAEKFLAEFQKVKTLSL